MSACSTGSGSHSAPFPSENLFGDNHRMIIIGTYYKIQRIIWKGDGIRIWNINVMCRVLVKDI